MRPISPQLLALLDEARVIVQARVESVADLRQRAEQWTACDGGLSSSLEVLADGGLRLKATAGAAVGSSVQNAWYRSREPGNTSPPREYIDPVGGIPGSLLFFAGILGQWTGTAANVAYGGIQAWLNPRFDSAKPKFVQTWECIVYQINMAPVDFNSVTNTQYVTLAPVAIAQTPALGESAGFVVFNFLDNAGKALPWHPDPYVPINTNENSGFSGSQYFIVCHGYDAKGQPATNIAWGYDNAHTSFTTGAAPNQVTLLAREVGQVGLDGSLPLPGAASSGIPALQLVPVTHAASATLTFKTGSPIDLGATPASAALVEFAVRAELPAGTSVLAEAAQDPAGSFVTFKDGQSAAAVVLAAQRKYDQRVTLTANAAADRTPIVRLLGARVVAKSDLGDWAEVVTVTEQTDPITHQTAVEEWTIRVIHNGERDYRDAISLLLSQNPPGQLYFRVFVGHRSLTEDLWLHLDDVYLDDVQLNDADVELICVSALSQLRQELPVLTSDAVAAPVADSSNPGAWTSSTGSILYPQIADLPEPPWAATTAYLAGQRILDSNSNVQLCTVGGTSGGGAPTWNTALGGFTIDSTVTWQNLGPISSALPDDKTYIQSPSNPSNADYIATLGKIGTPQQTVGAMIQFRAATAAGGQSLSCTVFLREGTTVRAQKGVTVNVADTGQGSYTPIQYLLSVAEMASITDWSNLNFLIRANGTGQIRVGWARLVVLGRRVPYVSSSISASAQGIMDDLINNQIALDGRFKGQQYVNASPALPVSKTIEQDPSGVTDLARAKAELDALAWITGTFYMSTQGKIANRALYTVTTGTDLVTGTTAAIYTPLVGPIRAIFPSPEVEPIAITPGWRQRLPLFRVPWGWNGQNWAGEAQVINAPALGYYRAAMIEADTRCPTETAKWIGGDGLARGLSARHSQAFGLGLMVWRFRTTHANPHLERGDVVVLGTDRFLAYDPIGTRAVAGKQWVTAVIVGRYDALGREWAVLVQNLAAIRPIGGALAIPPFSSRSPVTLGVTGYVGEAAGTSAGDNLNVFWAGTPAVAAVKIAVSTSGPPAPGTGTLFIGNSGTALMTGPYAFGTTIYVTITPYATVDATQAAGVAAGVVKLIDGSSISTPYNNQGSFLPVAADVNLLSYANNTGPGPTTGWLAWTWAAFSLPRPDGSSLSVPINTTQIANPPTPTVSSVAGGGPATGGTYYVKVAYKKDGHIIGLSAEAAPITIANGDQLKVTAPSNPGNMDGWTILVGTSTGNNFDQGFAGSFGVDFLQGAVAIVTSGTTKASTSWSQAIVDIGLAPSTAYWWYPYWDVNQALVRMNAGAVAQIAANAKVAQQDGHVPLSSAGVTVTMPAANLTASGAKGAGRLL